MQNISDQFIDNSYEGFNFFLSSHDETYVLEHDSAYIKDLRPRIEAAMARGQRYIQVAITYKGRLYDDHCSEVSWG